MKLPGSQRRGKGKVELMMTPMIDIVFNLVIFFLLMPSFEAKEGYLPTNLPSTQGPTPQQQKKEDSFRIDIRHVEPWEGENRKKATLTLNRDEISDNAELRRRLKQARQNIAPTGLDKEETEKRLKKVPVLISPDMAVYYKHVVAAFDAAIDAGFTNIQFTVPK